MSKKTGRKKGDKTCILNLKGVEKPALKHGLSALSKQYYGEDIEALITRVKLPEQVQTIVNGWMDIFKKQPTYNNLTHGLFQRLAFKLSWCELAEQWFMTNKLSAFSIGQDGQLIGSHLAIQYKIFSESLARDFDKLGLLPDKKLSPFKGHDLASALAEISETEETEK